MNFYNTKLWIPYQRLIFPLKSPDKRNLCLWVFGENTNFLGVYNYLNIKKAIMRYVYVPTITKPFRSMMDMDYRKEIMSYKLRPIKDFMGVYNKVEDKNFFFDSNNYLDMFDKRFNLKRYNTGRGYKVYNQFINTMEGIDSSKYKKTILYCVDLTKPINKKLQFRRFFVLYLMLFNWYKSKQQIKLPFDSIMLFIFNENGGRYIKIFDSSLNNNNIMRIRNIMMKLHQIQNDEEVEKSNLKAASKIASIESDLVSIEDENIVSKSIDRYVNSNKEINSYNLNNISNDNLVTKSIVYNVVGNIQDSKKIVKKINELPQEQKQIVLKSLTQKILPREDAKSSSRNIVVSLADVPEMIDRISPTHVFNKRKIDFETELKKDIINSFKGLEQKDIPLFVESLEVKEMQPSIAEISPSYIDRYFITLKDQEGDVHKVYFDIPHLDKDGTFTINNNKKILINQLVRFPIFFPKVGESRLESSYAIMKIHSKALKANNNYLIGFLGSYKLPLLMVFAYKYGLTDSLKDFGVTYKIGLRPE